MKQKRPVHPSLSSAIALSSARFDGFCRPKEWSSMTTAELLPTAPAWQMSSFGESRASKALYEQRGAEWALHNSQQISRVYPRGSRIDSDNYDPLPLWNVGVQMAALNWQTHDLPQQLNMSKFSVNDRCGYVLKPPYLRRRPAEEANARARRRCSSAVTLTVLRLDILSAVHVPTPGEVGAAIWSRTTSRGGRRRACGPSRRRRRATLVVEAFGGAFSGAAADRSKVHHGKAFCTGGERNGLNPRWDKEVAEVVASHPELTQIVLSVCYKPSPTAKAKTLGYAALPLSAVRSGVRCVPLCDERGARLLFCKLLVRATTDSCDTEATMARYHTTIQRDQQPLVRLPRDVREPFVQAAADVLGVSTAEDGPSEGEPPTRPARRRRRATAPPPPHSSRYPRMRFRALQATPPAPPPPHRPRRDPPPPPPLQLAQLQGAAHAQHWTHPPHHPLRRDAAAFTTMPPPPSAAALAAASGGTRQLDARGAACPSSASACRPRPPSSPIACRRRRRRRPRTMTCSDPVDAGAAARRAAAPHARRLAGLQPSAAPPVPPPPRRRWRAIGIQSGRRPRRRRRRRRRHPLARARERKASAPAAAPPSRLRRRRRTR